MPFRDLRHLPEPVMRRLAEADVLSDYGITGRGGRLIEAGENHRGRDDRQRAEARAAEDGTVTLDGYATVYDSAYPVLGGKASSWGWDETIVAGAADKSLAEQDNVFMLFDHEGHALGATGNRTLELSSDRVGLLTVRTFTPTDLADVAIAPVVSRVQDGTYDSMSFAFTVVRQEWNGDYTERFITELRLWDVSVVKWPANPATHIHARDKQRSGHSLALALAEAEALRLARRVA